MDVVELLEKLTEAREGKRVIEFYLAGSKLAIVDMINKKMLYHGSAVGFVADFLAAFNVLPWVPFSSDAEGDEEVDVPNSVVYYSEDDE